MTTTLHQLLEAHERILKDDVIVRSLVGVDDDGEVKIYSGISKTGVEPMYVVIDFIPVLYDDRGVYGDDDVIVITNFQLACWALDRRRALQLADACHEALRQGDWAVDPWSLMKVRMDGIPQVNGDRDTDWMQAQPRFIAMFGR